MLVGCLTSQPRASTFTPSFCNSPATCRQRSFFRAQRTRFAPISARPWAICRPSPTEPPVTMATRPPRLKICWAFIARFLLQQHIVLQLRTELWLYHMLVTNGIADQQQTPRHPRGNMISLRGSHPVAPVQPAAAARGEAHAECESASEILSSK